MLENSNDKNNSSELMLSSLNNNSNIKKDDNEIDSQNKNDNKLINQINNNTESMENKFDDIKLKSNLSKDPLTTMNLSNNNFNQEIEGFDNIGSTCYMNSFLQILLHIPGFLLELKIIKNEKNINNKLINNLISLYEDSNKKLYLKKIKECMGKVNKSYGEYYQNDSQEFGIDLINEIISSIKNDKVNYEDDYIEETNNINWTNKSEIKKEKYINYKNKYHNKNNEISLEKMFQFDESKLKISENENKIIEINNIFFETFLHIELVFPKNKINQNYELLDLFDYKYKYFNSEKINIAEKKNEDKNNTIEENNKLSNQNNIEKKNTSTSVNNDSWWDTIKEYCKYYYNYLFSSCFKDKNYNEDDQDNKVKYIYINRLASLPKVLIISIDRAILGKSLIDYRLSFKESLELNKYIDKDLLDDNSIKYNLYAVNLCYGHTKENGHYYSYVKISNNWYKFNDKIVTKENPDFSSKYVVGLYYLKNDVLID